MASAEEEEWNAYYDCVDRHKTDVASVIVSLDEGASLIVESLCMNESAATGNAMVRSRPNVFADNNNNYMATFLSFMSVINRETRQVLYREKLQLR